MKIEIIGIDMKVQDSLQDKIISKLSKFNRFFGDEAVCGVKLRPEKTDIRVEITLRIKKHLYRAEAAAHEAMLAMDEAVNVMEGQIRKHKTRIKRKKQQYGYMKEYLEQDVDMDVPEEKAPEIIRRKSFVIEAMDAEEAALQMEMMNHDFHLYLSPDTGKVCLIYKRNDGNYGLIEPEY